jgi:EAL domain-containing protein (putative c-di-GMP-specific phosphodiesterase class I)
MAADITRHQSDRDALLRLMNDVHPGASFETTAAGFCEAVCSIDGIQGAQILLLRPDQTVMTISMAGLQAPELGVGSTLRLERMEALLAATAAGPWWLDLADPATSVAIGVDTVAALTRMGATAIGYVGIEWSGQVRAVLAAATEAVDGSRWFASRAGILKELGSYAGTLMGGQAAAQFERDSASMTLLDIMDRVLFTPVFQPIVSLVTGEIRGYEALTRFHDGCPPDERIAEARRAGLGMRLETDLALHALAAAAAMAPGRWLSLNLSATTVLDGHLAELLEGAGRQIAIEITEHDPIQSYPAVRQEIRSHPGLLLSVDDAGAGFASMRHVLELQPDFVKLDIGLTAGLDVDPARQAMVAGMCHFARRTGATLIAEGVETSAQAQALRELGVELGQGYLFGRPGPLSPA